MEPAGDTLRILTFNIWNRQGPREKRLPLIRRAIERLQPDLIGLQEVLRFDRPDGAPTAASSEDQAQAIADGLGYHVTYSPAWEIGFGLRFGNAALTRWPVAKSETWLLPCRPGYEARERRALLHVEVDAPFARIPFYVTHLDWELHHGHVRLEQARFIVEKIEETARDFPAILVGDFNAEPDSDEIRFLRGHHTAFGKSPWFADLWRWMNEEGRGDTFARQNPYARLAHEPSRRLDYIFLRGPDRKARGEPIEARVVLDEPDGEVWPSDHFGVFAVVHAGPRAL